MNNKAGQKSYLKNYINKNRFYWFTRNYHVVARGCLPNSYFAMNFGTLYIKFLLTFRGFQSTFTAKFTYSL